MISSAGLRNGVHAAGGGWNGRSSTLRGVPPMGCSPIVKPARKGIG